MAVLLGMRVCSRILSRRPPRPDAAPVSLDRVGSADPQSWLAGHRDGAAATEALAFFDGLPPVAPAAVHGRWRGTGLPTGHPFDGLLEAHGWWGKEVLDAESVHPLLFTGRDGRPRPLDPAHLPLAVLRRFPRAARLPGARPAFAAVRPLRRAHRPGARLREVACRGVVSTAVVYDALPVIDALRAAGPDRLLGLMDMRGVEQPFFFVLQRVSARC
jgi:GXWXG protein/Domain of unknown function (DUF4334)